MRTHQQDIRMAVIDDLSLREVSLNDLKQAAKSGIHGVVHKSEKLVSLAQKFNYQTCGYEWISNNSFFGKGERSIDAYYLNGKLGSLKEPFFNFSDLRKDLKPFEGAWREIFSDFGDYVSPLLGKTLFISLLRRHHSPLYQRHFHTDKTIAAVLPLGDNRPSTVWKNAQGRTIHTENTSLVVTTPEIVHAIPSSWKKRAILVARPA